MQLGAQHVPRHDLVGDVGERHPQRDDLAGEVLGVGEVALGALAVLLDLHAVAVVLPVLREQDEGRGVRGLQRQDQRQQREVRRRGVELQLRAARRCSSAARRATKIVMPIRKPGGAHPARERLGEPAEAVARRLRRALQHAGAPAGRVERRLARLPCHQRLLGMLAVVVGTGCGRLVVIVVRAPVVGQQVVEHVVDADRADEAPRLVDDRQRDEVVAREHARDLGGGCRRGHRVERVVDDRAEPLVRGIAQHPLEVHGAEQPPGRRLVRAAG